MDDLTLDKATIKLFTTAVGEQQRQSVLLNQLARDVADLGRSIDQLSREIERMR